MREGAKQFQVEDGQYVLGLAVEVDRGGVLRAIERKLVPVADIEEDSFAKALEIERTDASAALVPYEHAVTDDVKNAGAWTNWGRLLHELGRMDEAVAVYQRAREHCADQSVYRHSSSVIIARVLPVWYRSG